MQRHLQAVFAAGILLGACPASALIVERLVTEFRDGVYRVSFEAVLAAPPSRVGVVLQDYTAYPSLDVRIRSSERLATEPGGAILLRTRIHACEALFIARQFAGHSLRKSTLELFSNVERHARGD